MHRPLEACHGRSTLGASYVLAAIPPMQPKQNFLVISALGDDHPGIIDKLTKAILDAECNIHDTRMTVLSGKFAILMEIDGKWDRLARLEDQLPELEKSLGLTIIAERSAPVQNNTPLLPYGVDVVALDQPGIVHNLAGFFAERSINIEDMVTSSYAAAHTGTPMFAVRITLGIPANVHIAGLRDEFMDFCDSLNIDAVLEPVKG
jgi:glycine cleavage system transcriptional repressor